MTRVKALRWSVGANLPEELLAPLSPSECDFFKAYSKCVPTPPGKEFQIPGKHRSHTSSAGC